MEQKSIMSFVHDIIIVIENGLYMQVMTMISTWQQLKMPNGDWCDKNEN